jgi:hypothetical protein
MVAAQVAALTYQRQLTASTVANSSWRTEQQFFQLALQQNMMHENMHHIIVQVNMLSFNQSNAGSGLFGGYGRRRCGRNHSSWRNSGQVPTLYKAGQFGTHSRFSPGLPQEVVPHGGMPHGRPTPRFVPPGPPGGILQGRQTRYRPMPPMHMGRYGNPPQLANQAPPASPYYKVVKCFANWNVCYSYGFNVANSHTSVTCPAHLQRASHNIYFTQNHSQQYINMRHPCSTKKRHTAQLLTM